jgi:hypothetical protein
MNAAWRLQPKPSALMKLTVCNMGMRAVIRPSNALVAIKATVEQRKKVLVRQEKAASGPSLVEQKSLLFLDLTSTVDRDTLYKTGSKGVIFVDASGW